MYSSRFSEFAGLFKQARLGCSPELKMNLIPGDHISGFIAFTGYYEHVLTKRILSVAKNGGMMVDIGANLGYFSIIWAKACKKNRVLAIEASPRNITLLEENVAANGLGEQIEIQRVAAGRERGKLKFDVGPQQQTGWGGFTTEPDGESIEVEVIRVDEIVPENTKVRLLKVDIEGADTWALMGCEKLLRDKRVDEIWFEQNKPRMSKLSIGLEEATDFLSDLGYATKAMSNNSQDLVEWCAKPK